jgi:hypothetical protein
MGKPVKIRKKKSFMFTTRHYSFMSVMGIVLGAINVFFGVAMVTESYRNKGSVDAGYGSAGLFSVFLSVIGIVCGIRSLGERDTYIAPAIVAIAVNGAVILWWIFMIVVSEFF